jgi:hypothetical protein
MTVRNARGLTERLTLPSRVKDSGQHMAIRLERRDAAGKGVAGSRRGWLIRSNRRRSLRLIMPGSTYGTVPPAPVRRWSSTPIRPEARGA